MEVFLARRREREWFPSYLINMNTLGKVEIMDDLDFIQMHLPDGAEGNKVEVEEEEEVTPVVFEMRVFCFLTCRRGRG